MLLTKVLCCPLAGAEGKVGVQLILTIQWKERKTSQFWNAVPVPSLLPDIFLFLSYLVKLGINCISTIGKFYFFFSCSLLMLSSCRCFGPVMTSIHIFFTSFPTPVVRFFPEALQDHANKIFQTRS